MKTTSIKPISSYNTLMSIIMLYWKDSIGLKEKHDISALFTVAEYEMQSFVATRTILYPELTSESIAVLFEQTSYLFSFCLSGGDIEDLDLIYITELESEILIQALNWSKHLFEEDHYAF